jgi:two-component sensor histidine kinase
LETLGHLRNVSVILENMGGVYVSQGDYARALAHYHRSLELSEELDDPLGIASNLNNIGRIYVDQGAYAQALPHFERSLDIFEASGYQAGTATVLSDIGNVYEHQNRDAEALTYYNRSLEMCETMEDQAGMSAALYRIGNLYLENQDYAQALARHQQSLQIRKQLADQHGIAVSLQRIGTLYQRQGDHTQARYYGEKALSVGQAVGNVGVLQGISELLYQTYKATGQAPQALAMHELYHQMRDSLNSEENQRATIRFEFERKALADSLANQQEKALAQVEYENQLSQQRLQLGFAGGVGGLLALLAVVLYRNNRRRHQTNQLLSTQNGQIEAKSQQNELLLKEIHHRVKNNLQTISSLLYLQSAHIKDAEVKQAVAAGQHRVESMALIHQKLYQRDNLAGIEMKDYLTNLGQSLLSTFEADPERIQLQLDMEALELDVDTAVPLGLITNELITNALKYAFPAGRPGTLTISLKRTGEELVLYVADDGVGSANKKSGTSFGSQLIKLLTQQLGGRIEQGTEGGYWTRVVV